MTTDDFVARIESTVQKILMLKSRGENPMKVEGTAVINHLAEIVDDPVTFTDAQITKLRGLAVTLLVSEAPTEFSRLSQILALGGACEHADPLETAIEPEPEPGLSRLRYEHIVRASLLEQAGVFEPGERPIFYDRCGLYIRSKNAGREGTLFLTKKRIILSGPYLTGLKSTRRHLYYEDWREKPYVSSLDYLYIDQLMKIEKKKREIKAKYHTWFWEEKDRTIYGAYFIRFDLPTSISAKEADVDIRIRPRRLKEYDSKRDEERRNAALYERIMQLRSEAGPTVK